MLERVDRTGRLLRSSSLPEALRERTLQLHSRAERSGVVADILRGRATLDDYGLLLRNLLPVYRTMEEQLEHHRGSPIVGGVARPEVYRAGAIEADLRSVGIYPGDERLLPPANAYVNRILDASGGDGGRLIAHAYARYLGDLSGGQILKRLLARLPGLPDSALSFYEFPAIADLGAFKLAYRAAIERAGNAMECFHAVVEEGAVAFELNIALSQAVQAVTGRARTSAI
jgi:heme oxygenase (biliverdin-producing, ferredoxin)